MLLRKPANVTKLLRVTNYNGSLCAEKQRHRGRNIALAGFVKNDQIKLSALKRYPATY